MQMSANMMYLMIIILYYLNSRIIVQAGSGAFLVDNSKSNEAVCVLTGEATRSAVAWTISANATLASNFNHDNIKPSDISEGISSQFPCTFEDACMAKWNDEPGIWFDDLSYKYPFAPRTDSAWNNFDLLYSEIREIGEIRPEHKFPITSNISYIGVSVKVASTARVIFCDGDRFLTSRCYIVVLAGYDASRISFIRKCVRGLPIEHATEESCKIIRTFVKHDQPLVDDKLWRHFTFFINWTNTMTELKVYAKVPGESGYNQILEYQDENIDHIRIKYFGVRSYTENGLWKIHKYRFRWTKTMVSANKPDILYFGFSRTYKFSHKNNYICLKMSLVLCPACSFQLHVEDDREKYFHSKIVHGKNFTDSNGFMHWREEIFNISLLDNGFTGQYKNYILRYSTNLENGASDPFWGIDDIRECYMDETKIFQFKFDVNYERETCQIIDENIFKRVEDFNIKSIIDVNKQPNCSHWFTNSASCEGVRISSLDTLRSQCFPGYNGHYCRDKTKLNTEFSVIQSGYGNMIVKPNIIFSTGSTANYMKFQYQYDCHCGSVFNPWINLGDALPLSDFEKEFRIPADLAAKNLVLDKAFLLRIVLYVDGNSEFEHVPGKFITPTCTIGDKSLLKFSATENSITMTQENGDLNDCPISYYDIEILDKTNSKAHCEGLNKCTLKDLKPFTEYNIIFTGKRNETFRENYATGDARPESVQELVVYSREPNSLSLRWKSPKTDTIMGMLLGYTIRCNHIISFVNISGSECSLWNGYVCHTIQNLTGHSYNIEVRAHTRNRSPGSISQLLGIETKQRTPSVPKDLHLKNKNTSEISWKHPWLPNGKIEYFKITWELISTELISGPTNNLASKIIEITNDMKEYTYALSGLTPASTYSVKVTAYNENKGIPSEIEVRTPLVAPHVTGEIQLNRLTHNQIQITIPSAKDNVTKQSGFYIVVSEFNSKIAKVAKKQELDERLEQIWNEAKVNENENIVTRVAKHFPNIPSKEDGLANIIIRSNDSISGHQVINGSHSGSSYNIAVVYYNELNGQRMYRTLFYKEIEEAEANYALVGLLVMLLVPIAFVIYVLKRRKSKLVKEVEDENDYVDVEALLAKNPNARIIPVLQRPAKSHCVKHCGGNNTDMNNTYHQT